MLISILYKNIKKEKKEWIPFGFWADLAQGFHCSERLSPFLSEFRDIWSLVPCSQDLLLHVSSLASKKDFFSSVLRPKRKLVVLAPHLWPPLLSQVPLCIWFEWKIPLRPSTDECSLSNHIESTEINFYNPNWVSAGVPVIIRYLGPILPGTGVPWEASW